MWSAQERKEILARALEIYQLKRRRKQLDEAESESDDEDDDDHGGENEYKEGFLDDDDEVDFDLVEPVNEEVDIEGVVIDNAVEEKVGQICEEDDDSDIN